jgi:hypothetical protein
MLRSIPPEVLEIIVHAVMNPGTIVAGYLIGRNADQPQKIIVGAFAAGIAGVLFALLVMKIGLSPDRPKLFPGIFVLSFVLGALWAWLGYFAGTSRRQK